jgi:hypothetical protein
MEQSLDLARLSMKMLLFWLERAISRVGPDKVNEESAP